MEFYDMIVPVIFFCHSNYLSVVVVYWGIYAIWYVKAKKTVEGNSLVCSVFRDSLKTKQQ